jgi:stress-induced morphogen
MSKSQLKQKIHDVLKSVYFNDPDDMVDVSDGLEDSIHVVVVSRKFDGHGLLEKNDLIWSVLVDNLPPEEWGKVSLIDWYKSGGDQSGIVCDIR